MDIHKTYGLIGRHISHSFSPAYFQKKFKQLNLSDRYVLLDMEEIAAFPRLLNQSNNQSNNQGNNLDNNSGNNSSHVSCHWSGFNVTIPYKEAIMKYLHEISPQAKAIGAVNTVVINKKGPVLSLTGYNTDYIGFRESLKPKLMPWHTSALVLGTGGASKAVCYALKELGLKYQLVSRHLKGDQLSYLSLSSEKIGEHLLIINTTPLGMWPNETACPQIPYGAITDKHLCYDLIYNPKETLFLSQCKAQGAQIKNGIEMLELQAEASYRLWNQSEV